MNFDEYRTTRISLYAELAKTVAFILEQAVRANGEIPKPQTIQYRAKSPESVRDRLEEDGKLDTQSLETDRRDLAGARLIFYTDTDIDRFARSPLVSENFEVEDARIHHPTLENDNTNYRARHFTVRLRADRVKLAEYAKFEGLRCEIQVQTILNHAWSETSHNLYKEERRRTGYGARARDRLKKRFDRIMTDYLERAGLEMRAAQAESERIRQGKALVDKDILEQLAAARDNNERYEILSNLRDNVIQEFDDVPGEYDKLRQPLLNAARAAQKSADVPIQIGNTEFPGRTANDVVSVIIEIFGQLRYQNIEGTFQALAELYKDSSDE